MRANSVPIHAQKLSTNFSEDSCRILTRFRCAQIHMPKTKVENSIEHLASNMFNSRSYNFRTVELNWRACQLTCSLNIHHKHIRHYHLLSIASFLSTRFIKDLNVRYPHRLNELTFTHTLTYIYLTK